MNSYFNFCYIVWNPNPKIFDLGFFSLRWYSLMFMLAFVIGYQLLKRLFAKAGRAVWLLDKLTVYVGIGILAGARLGHCLFYDPDYYYHHLPEVFLPVQFEPEFKITGFQGLASHGGAIGIFIALYLFSRRYKTNFLWLADQLACVVPLAGCLIRLGNLMNSEIIGKPASLPWAFVFSRDDAIPRHPAQLYEALVYTLIFFMVWLIRQRNKNKPGFTFGLSLVLLFSSRFLIEFFKEDQAAFEAPMFLNMGQLLSIPLILTGIWLMLMKFRKQPAGNSSVMK